MDGEKFNMKIENKPILPDLNIVDVSKEVNNMESIQRIRKDIEEKEKEKENVARKRHEQTVSLMKKSITIGVVGAVLALIAILISKGVL